MEVLKMTKRNKKLILCASLLLSLSFGSVTTVNANNVGVVSEYKVANNGLDGLDGLGTTDTTGGSTVQSMTPEDQANRDSATAVSGLFQSTGITDESTSQASTFLEPLARGINIVCAFILGATSLGIFLVTALDLLYIAFPPVRNMLNPQPQGGAGGYGGGQQSSAIRWISDEAIACAGGASAGGGMGSPMGGMGGGMGSPMGGSPQGGAKSMIMSYLKKRTVFLVVFAISVILFTSTVFTDLGLKLGMLILSWITGMNGSIPM